MIKNEHGEFELFCLKLALPSGLFLQVEEPQEVQTDQQEMTEAEGGGPEEEVEDVSQVTEAEEVRDDCAIMYIL